MSVIHGNNIINLGKSNSLYINECKYLFNTAKKFMEIIILDQHQLL